MSHETLVTAQRMIFHTLGNKYNTIFFKDFKLL